MRIALLGDHSDGRDFVQAAVHSGGHQLVVYCGPNSAWARQLAPSVRITLDVEDVLADPQVQACVVAVAVQDRLDVARRALQSERHALVVHPVDVKPDGAYELGMLQGDVHQVLLPLLAEGFTPIVQNLRQAEGQSFIEVNVTALDYRLAADKLGRHCVLPGWHVLRSIGGEIREVSAFAKGETIDCQQPLFVAGVFESGRPFRMTYRCEAAVHARDQETPWLALRAHNEDIQVNCGPEEWSQVVGEFDAAVEHLTRQKRAEPAAGANERPHAKLSWRDEVRALELDDAATRSLSKRRAQLMEYQDASEEVGFKGTMTLVGCALLWIAIMLLVLSAWAPWAGWIILPLIVIFLGLQILRYVVPK